MKKRIFTLILTAALIILPACAKVDKNSQEYLINKKHFTVMPPIVSFIAKKAIKKQLKKETGANFKVKFQGYTLSSMKAGIFKNLEITGKKVTISDIYLPYLKLKTISEYNWIDYTQNPIVFKSDMDIAYDIHMSERTINDALKTNEYAEALRKVNNIFYPLFSLHDINIEIKDSKAHINITYNIPLKPSQKDRILKLTSQFRVVSGKIKATNVTIDSHYGNIPISKVTNLLNLLDPLSFTIGLINDKKCDGKIENIKIVDDIIQINGRIFVKGDE